MRILYHHRTLGDGADGIHIREIVKSLRKQGHEVKLVSLIGEEQLANPQKKVAKSNYGWIKKLMPGFVFELVEIGYNDNGYIMLMDAAKDFQPDAIYDRDISYNYSSIRAASQLGIPMILESNSPYATQRKIWEKIWFPRLIQKYETRITNDADAVIVVSSALKDHLIKHGTNPEHIIVMPNGTDPAIFDPAKYNGTFRKKYDIAGDEVVLGFVGVLRNWHNIETLLEAFQELNPAEKNLKLLFVGDGDIQSELEAYAERLNVRDRVIFTGRVPHQEVPDHIAAFDVAISPHVTYYSSPMKILEYMAMGKCVVAPDMQNIRDLIRPGETGLLFKPKDKEDLKRALMEVVTDHQNRKRIGETATKEIRQNFTWDKNAAEVVELIERLKSNRS